MNRKQFRVAAWTCLLLATLRLDGIAGVIGDARLPDAAMRGDAAAIRSLIQEKIDVNSAFDDGKRALCILRLQHAVAEV